MKLVPNKIPQSQAINLVAKRYKALSYYVQLLSMLELLYPASSFDNIPKSKLHKLLNDVFVKYYKGEEILKYLLAIRYFDNQEVVGAYEINVHKSRADFVIINGRTTCFEIKSRLDSLSKLEKQIKDYQKVFDYNYLVVDKFHYEKAKSILPKDWGLWCYENGTFDFVRKARLNKKICVRSQLTQMSKPEIIKYIGIETISVDEVIENVSGRKITSAFRKALKNRYKNRWEFITSHKAEIMPVDYQFFFNNNIQPRNIYNH